MCQNVSKCGPWQWGEKSDFFCYFSDSSKFSTWRLLGSTWRLLGYFCTTFQHFFSKVAFSLETSSFFVFAFWGCLERKRYFWEKALEGCATFFWNGFQCCSLKKYQNSMKIPPRILIVGMCLLIHFLLDFSGVCSKLIELRTKTITFHDLSYFFVLFTHSHHVGSMFLRWFWVSVTPAFAN